MLFSGSPPLTPSCLVSSLIQPGLPAHTHIPAIHSALGHSAYISYQGNVPQMCPQVSLIFAIPPLRFPPHSCVKWTVEANHDARSHPSQNSPSPQIP